MRKLSTPLMSDINITPLTDVMLVLLIIFMIASPFISIEEEEGEDLNVPKTETAVNLGEAEHLLAINADSGLLLDGIAVTREELYANLYNWVTELYESEAREGLKLFIAAEETVTWKTLAEVMSLAKKAGVEKIGMVEKLIEHEEIPPVNGGEQPPE
jgi:biopolymer transport protein TolR